MSHLAPALSERNETTLERSDRHLGELMQEVRVAQTGAERSLDGGVAAHYGAKSLFRCARTHARPPRRGSASAPLGSAWRVQPTRPRRRRAVPSGTASRADD